MKKGRRSIFQAGGDPLRKCGIWGCGASGATVAYTLAQTGWFDDMVLIDPQFRIAEAEAADLSHALPFHVPMEIYAGDFADLADCGLIILAEDYNTSGILDSMEHLRRKVQHLRAVAGNIRLYNRDAILLCISEPVEPQTMLIRHLSELPASRVIGSGTVADTARLKQMMGRYLGVDSRNVHTFLIGEHGREEIPVWSSANISGIDLHRYYDGRGKGYDASMLNGLFRDMLESRETVLQAKRVGHYALASAVKRIVSAIVHDESTILTVCTEIGGTYGLENVCMSLPCVLGRRGVRQVLEIPLNEEEEAQLFQSARRLRERSDQLDSFLFQSV